MLSASIKMTDLFKGKNSKIRQRSENAIRTELYNVARTATSISPVDTGAYVTSFSFSGGVGRPRGKSSRNKAPVPDKQSARDQGLDNLIQDINRIPNLIDGPTVVLRNGSPHAVAVEYKHGYAVFARVRNIYG